MTLVHQFSAESTNLRSPYDGERMDKYMADITKDFAKRGGLRPSSKINDVQISPEVKAMNHLRDDMQRAIDEAVDKAVLRIDAFNKVIIEELTRELRLDLAIIQEQISEINAELFEDE